MKKSIFFVLLILYGSGVLMAQDCVPNEEGLYMYYGNLNAGEVSNNFNRADLIKLLSESRDKRFNDEFGETLEKVEKSFPDAVTDFLQRSVTIYSKNDNLVEELSGYKSVFGLVEFICEPKDKLLYEPNDYQGSGHYHRSHLELIKAKEAFDVAKGNSRILIGITDTDLEYCHEDLRDKIHEVTFTPNPSSSLSFHGTMVSGCAAADTDNGVGISSVGFRSEIVFSDRWASDNEVLRIAQIPGVRVINCSWINHCNPSVTREAVYDEILNVHDVVVVAGAGNKPSHCGDNAYVYPAAYPSVISVSSVGHLSDRGYVDPIYGANNWKDVHEQLIGDVTSTHHHNDRVNICAPGYNVKTTALNNSYGGSWGTSFASPIVAGVCALVASVNPCLTAPEIRDIVLSTADASLYNIPENQNYIGLLGTGRVDAEAAVLEALRRGRLFIQNQDYTGYATESSETELYAGRNVTNIMPVGDVTVRQGANVTFRATHKIVLSAGFKVERQAAFRAAIVNSNCL